MSKACAIIRGFFKARLLIAYSAFFLIHSNFASVLLQLRLKSATMSFMRGDMLAKSRKLVKGLARTEPAWLKAMEKAPPATFPRSENKLRRITFPEDPYVSIFYERHPDAKFDDPIKISSFDPPQARQFAWRVHEMIEQGVDKQDAVAVADNEYLAATKARKKAYARLREIRKLQGKRPPPNPYPSALKEIQAEEKVFVRDRFFNPRSREIVEKLKIESLARMERR